MSTNPSSRRHGPRDHRIDKSTGLYDRTKYGINYPFLYCASTKTIPNKIPTVSLPNFDLLDGGPYPSHSGGIVYSASDNITKVIGSHTVKAGFNFEYSGENNFDQITVRTLRDPPTTRTDASTSRIRARAAPQPKLAVANAAEGLFDTYGEIGQRSYTLYRGTVYEGFLQDQWHATPNLVIEAGVRYSWYNPYYAKWGNQSVFNARSYNPANAVTVNPNTDVVTGGDRYNGVVIPGSGFPSSAAGHVDPAILSADLPGPVPRLQAILAHDQDRYPTAVRHHLPGSAGLGRTRRGRPLCPAPGHHRQRFHRR